MIEVKGKKFSRAMHFDFHTSPNIENMLENFNADEFAMRLKDAHVEYINFPARCNMGFSYYDTKVGIKYKSLKFDLLKEIITACHKQNIGVTAYINVSINHELFADHNEYLIVNKDGSVYGEDKVDNFFRVACYNSEYKKHLFSEIDEILTYDIDGIFLDCPVLRECYCDKCKADMIKRGFNTENDSDYLEYQKVIRVEFLSEIKEKLKGKNIKHYFNDVKLPSDMQSHAEIECLTTDALWGYGYFGPHSALSSTIYKDRVYMSGRFQGGWGDFGGIKPVASMQYDLYDAMMNGFSLSFGDHMHPVYGLEDEVIKRVKTVFAEKLLYEPFTNGCEPVAEVGAIFNGNSASANDSANGLSKMLKELKIPVKFYHKDVDLSLLKLLIISEDLGDDIDFAEKLKAFLKSGNKVIFTGEGILFAERFNLVDYVKVVEKDTSDNAYYSIDGGMRWSMYNPSVILKNNGGKVIADYVKNIFNLIWDGRQSYFYRPQGEKTDYSACVIGKNSACICFNIFSAYKDMVLREHKDLVLSIINELMPDRFISVKGLPITSEIAVTKNDEHSIVHVKATYPENKMSRGIIEEHNVIKPAEISIDGKYKVYAIPENKKVRAKYKNGKTIFSTGEVCGYKAFLLKNK